MGVGEDVQGLLGGTASGAARRGGGGSYEDSMMMRSGWYFSVLRVLEGNGASERLGPLGDSGT